MMKMSTIGNTPMIKINYEYKGKLKYVYTKLEYYNLTVRIEKNLLTSSFIFAINCSVLTILQWFVMKG